MLFVVVSAKVSAEAVALTKNAVALKKDEARISKLGMLGIKVNLMLIEVFLRLFVC